MRDRNGRLTAALREARAQLLAKGVAETLIEDALAATFIDDSYRLEALKRLGK